MTRRDLLVASGISLALWAIAIAAIFFAVSCGPEPVVQDPLPDKLQPNVAQACARAIACGVFMEQQRGACEACLEHVDEKQLAELRETYGDLPPLDTVDCSTIRSVAGAPMPARNETIWSCVVAQSYGAGPLSR